jgi:hypothetical protein
LRLTPLVELENYDRKHIFLVPFETWRGRLAIEGGYKWRLTQTSLFSVSLGLEHESTYPTQEFNDTTDYSSRGSVENDVLLRIDYLRLSFGDLAVATLQRIHVLTCTEPRYACHNGDKGSVGYAAALAWPGAGNPERQSAEVIGGVAWFPLDVAAHARLLLGRHCIASERRIDGRA